MAFTQAAWLEPETLQAPANSAHTPFARHKQGADFSVVVCQPIHGCLANVFTPFFFPDREAFTACRFSHGLTDFCSPPQGCCSTQQAFFKQTNQSQTIKKNHILVPFLT